MADYFMVYSNNGLIPKRVMIEVRGKNITSLTEDINFEDKKICFLNSKGSICTGKGYVLASLSEDKAKKLIEEYREKGLFQNGKISSLSHLERGSANY